MKKLIIILAILELSSCGGSGESTGKIKFEDVSIDFFKSFPIGPYEIFNINSLVATWELGDFKIYPVGIVLQAQPMPVVDFNKYEIHGKVWPDGYW